MRKRWMLQLVAGLILALAGASTALAHATLVKSEPAYGSGSRQRPDQAMLLFSGRIEVALTRARLIGPDGAPGPALPVLRDMENGQVAWVELPDNMATGSHVLVWHTLSTDGHAAAGHVLFHAGSPTPGMTRERALLLVAPFEQTTELPGGAGAGLRWVELVGLMGAASWPLLALLGLKPPRPTFAFSAGLAAAGLAVGLPVALVQAGALNPDMIGTYLLFTLQGTWWVLRGVLLAVLVLAVRRRWSTALQALLGAALLLPMSAAGHAGSVGTGVLPAVGAHWLHLLASALWAGGLLHLALGLGPELRDLTVAERLQAWRQTLTRFGPVAAVGALTLAVTGAYSARLQVGEPTALGLTSYGRTLLFKVALAAALLLLAFAALVVTRWLRRAPSGAALGRLVLAQAGAAALVLLAAAPLASATPGRVEYLQLLAPAALADATGPVTIADEVGGRPVTMLITPLVLGEHNTYEFTFAGSAPEKVEAELIMIEMGHGAILDLQPAGPGRWQATMPLPDMSGRWTVRLKATGQGRSDTTFIYFKVPEPLQA